LLEFQRSTGAMELHFNQPSDGDLPSEPIDASWEGDGLLVYRHTVEEAEAWARRGIAAVNLSTEFPGTEPQMPRVTVDNHAVGRAAAEHLAALGLRDFAYVHESMRRYSAERLEAFRAAVEAGGGHLHQIDVPASAFAETERPRQIEECMREPFLALPRPCGVLAKDDIAATWTLRLMKSLGIACPGEMPLLGIANDIVFCHTASPPLSSVPYPARHVGLVAAELLWRMMNGEAVPPDHRIAVPPGPVVRRESTRHVVLADSVVTRAMELIRQEAMHRPVSVGELSRTVGVSRESLRQRFHAVLGHSPKREIERLRRQHVLELLLGTNLPLAEVASECGFADAAELCRFVKRQTGNTPGSIRREAER